MFVTNGHYHNPIWTSRKMRLLSRFIHAINSGKSASSNTAAANILRESSTPGIAMDYSDNVYYYASLLDGCANVKSMAVGQHVHTQLLVTGHHRDIFLSNKLVSMYVNCGSMEDARQVFGKMSQRNVFSWHAMIAGYVGHGRLEESLKCYYQMREFGVKADNFIFSSILKVCAGLAALQQGKEIHSHIVISGFESYVFVGNALIDMYAKCGSLNDAFQLFGRMPQRDLVSWTAMIAGAAQNGWCHEALELFREMQLVGVKPNGITIASVLPACARLMELEQGKEIHVYVIKAGFEFHAAVGSALVAFYAKFGNTEDAFQVFDSMTERDVVIWNAMISGYAQNGYCEETYELFEQMRVVGLKPNLITWNTMIVGFAQNGYGVEALKFFRRMDIASLQLSSVTIASILSASSSLAALEKGKEIHGYVVRNGFESEGLVGSALVAMYAKCGSLQDAQEVFDKSSRKDEISWTSMISGYSQCGHSDEALKVFRQMLSTGMKPDLVTIASVLPAYAHLASLRQGKEVHDYIIRNGLDSDVVVASSLIVMYAKCGNLENAQHVFVKISEKDAASWNAMLAGYAIHGYGEDAFTLFCQMQQTGTKPDHITFITVLSACSYAGLVEEGWQCFNSMSQDYQIKPCMEHYACMVDLLGRSGHLNKAHNFIEKMPIEPNAIVWGALLGACKIHCNIELGEYVADRLFELEPENIGSYVLLSNIYAAAGKWSDVTKVRKMMKDKGLKKRAGCSWIEVNNKTFFFVMGDRSHPQQEIFYAELENWNAQMKAAGYMPDTNSVLHDVEEEEKEQILYGHSEKLAIVFGIVNTCPDKPIRVMKNLRMCQDCHTATKFLSKIAQREIFVRDGIRFHHFKDGLCSCRDYW